MTWADEEVLAALERCQSPTAAWLELFAHVVAAEHVWLSRLEGRPQELPVWPTLTLAESATVARKNRDGFEAFLAGLNPEDDRRHVRYVNSAGQEFLSTIGDILLQVILHGTYHRGQIASAMRAAGAAPAPTDYIGFVRGTPAATRQGGARQE